MFTILDETTFFKVVHEWSTNHQTIDILYSVPQWFIRLFELEISVRIFGEAGGGYLTMLLLFFR